MKKIFPLFFPVLFSFLLVMLSGVEASAQFKTFNTVFSSLKDEHVKVDSLNKLCSKIQDDDTVIMCAEKVKELAEKLNYKKGLAQSLNNIGVAYKHLEKGKEALQYHLQAVQLREELGDKKEISSSYNNIGNTYDLLGNFQKAIDFHTKALALREELKDTLGMAKSLNNIASAYIGVPDYYRAIDYGFRSVKLYEAIGKRSANLADVLNNLGISYERLREFEKALSYYEKALAIQKELGNNEEIAKLLDNMAIIYHQQGQDTTDKKIRYEKFQSALKNYSQALDILSESGENDLSANIYNNVGNTYWELNDFPKAFDALNKSLDIYKKLENKNGIANAFNSLSVHFKLQKKFNESIKYALTALAIADSINDVEQIKNACEMLSVGYRETKNYEKSLFYFSRYTDAKDKLTNVEGAKKLVQQESKIEFEKQEQQMKADREKERIAAEEKNRRQKIISWSVGAGLLLVIVFAGFIFRSLRVIQQQKKEVEKQKELADSRRIIAEEQKFVIEKSKKEIEEKNKDITDSIHYASRIQRALFTSEDYISRHLKEYFILFKPKDIVSGDFYWAFAPIESAGKQNFFFACCDCTGHGVPGSFMSLLNISFLNEAVMEKDLREPEKILNDVRSSVVKALAPALDGMDASLCKIDLKNKTLDVSCAMNPVWLIQNNKVNEINPDKMPVGIHDRMDMPFTKHSVQLQQGDIIYAFTDGFADQFGGPKNKKFRYKQLEETLLANSFRPMTEQKEILSNTFENWKGANEQVDDVLVIGIKI